MVRMITGELSDEVTVSYDEALHILTDRENIDLSERNVLVSHQFYLPAGSDGSDIERMDSERVTVGNIDAVSADMLEKFDYAALGHIHKPMCAGSEYYRYCGTPLACSVSEAEQEKAIIVAELKEKHCKKDSDNNSNNKCDIEITTIPLVPLRQVRVIRGTSMEVLARACDDYVSVTLTDDEDIDVIDMQDRIRNAFPNLLEVKREGIKTADYSAKIMQDKELDPFSLCKAFIGDMDDDEISILSDVINVVQGVSE
jgi:exonuclease SbcD